MSYGTFCDATWGENLYQARFSNLKISVSFWDLGPIFCNWAQFLYRSNFCIATWGLTQLLNWFLRGGWFYPLPSDPQNLDPLTCRFKTENISLSLKAIPFFQPQHMEFLIFSFQKLHNQSVILHLGRLLRCTYVKVWIMPWKLKKLGSLLNIMWKSITFL